MKTYGSVMFHARGSKQAAVTIRNLRIARLFPVTKDTVIESSEEWLKRNKPTICEPRYCAPERGAGL